MSSKDHTELVEIKKLSSKENTELVEIQKHASLVKMQQHMSLKDQLKATKEEALDYDTIANQVKETLLDAARKGESTIVLPLKNEYDLKTDIITHFLTREGITFKKIYNSRQVEKKNYLDPHMAFYQEALARNGGSSIYTYMDTEYTFQGIRVFL